MSNYQREAARAVERTRNIPSFAYRGELPIGETWAFTISRHRDSEILGISNFEVIRADLEKRFPDDCEVVHCSHWAVGWIDHLAVRMLDDVGEVTPAGIAAIDWAGVLENYPVASDEDLSAREYDATLDGIGQALRSVADEFEIPAGRTMGLPGELFSWFWEHDQGAVESRDGGGGYPSDDQIRAALDGLGFARAEVA